MSNIQASCDTRTPVEEASAEAETIRETFEPLVTELKAEIRQLRDEVRQLRGERSEEAMLSVPEAASIAGISERKMRTLIHSGEVPSARIGRRVLVPRKAFQAWLDRKVESAQ